MGPCATGGGSGGGGSACEAILRLQDGAAEEKDDEDLMVAVVVVVVGEKEEGQQQQRSAYLEPSACRSWGLVLLVPPCPFTSSSYTLPSAVCFTGVHSWPKGNEKTKKVYWAMGLRRDGAGEKLACASRCSGDEQTRSWAGAGRGVTDPGIGGVFLGEPVGRWPLSIKSRSGSLVCPAGRPGPRCGAP